MDLVLSGAYPVYLDSYPIEEYSMYGAVPLEQIKRKILHLKEAGRLDKVKMLLLTNCTFDGMVYNVERVMEEVLSHKTRYDFSYGMKLGLHLLVLPILISSEQVCMSPKITKEI